jgi:hypothetical protein
LIGTKFTGTKPLPNGGNGVNVIQTVNNTIGGEKQGAGNVIASNGGDGVRFWGSSASNNHVLGNWIGTDTSGQQVLGNTAHGVWFALGAHDNNVGGLAPGDGNVIAYNAKAGVAVGDFNMDASTVHNAILSNSIYGNVMLGIDLGDDGVTQNIPGGPHVGPNAFQNTPTFDSVLPLSSSTSVVLRLNSIPLKSFIVQIFASPVPDALGCGQGKTLVATIKLSTDIFGNGVGSTVLSQDLAGQYLSATATDPMNDTSEFSRIVSVPRGRFAPAGAAAGPGSSRAGNADSVFETRIAPAEEAVDTGLANVASSVLEPTRRLADSVFQTSQAEWHGVPTQVTQACATTLTAGRNGGRDHFFARAELDTTHWDSTMGTLDELRAS